MAGHNTESLTRTALENATLRCDLHTPFVNFEFRKKKIDALFVEVIVVLNMHEIFATGHYILID